jgi:predicted transcriptional regulator
MGLKKGTNSSRLDNEFVRLLVRLGMNKNIAILLAFFTETTQTTFREIEAATGLCEPQISVAMKYLHEQGWTTSHASEKGGSLIKDYELIIPINEIMTRIGDKKEQEINKKIALLGKLKNYL